MCPGPTGRPGLLLLGESSECAGQAVYSTGCAHRKVVCGHKTDGVHRSGGLHRACTSPVLYATRTPPTLTPKQPTGNPNVQRARRLNKPTPSAPLSCSPQSRPPVPELVLPPLFCTSLHLCNSPFVPLCTRGGNSVGGGCRRLTIPPGSKPKHPPPPQNPPLPPPPPPLRAYCVRVLYSHWVDGLRSMGIEPMTFRAGGHELTTMQHGAVGDTT